MEFKCISIDTRKHVLRSEGATPSAIRLAANFMCCFKHKYTYTTQEFPGRNPERFPKIFISSKILPVLALAVLLSPLAAQARSNPQLGPNQTQVMTGSDTIDNPTTINSGVTANAFRDAMGG